jgi:hypothetical protein
LGEITEISAPKTIDRLDKISNIRNEQRKYDESSDTESDDDGGIKISDQSVDLLDIVNIDDDDDNKSLPDLLIDDIEVL